MHQQQGGHGHRRHHNQPAEERQRLPMNNSMTLCKVVGVFTMRSQRQTTTTRYINNKADTDNQHHNQPAEERQQTNTNDSM
jgi:hypothetical protein